MRRPGGKPALGDPDKGDPSHAHAHALALLARRDYSSRELTKKLESRGYLEHAITPVIEELLASNQLNDERYSGNVVAYRARRGQGPARIRSELQRSGLSRAMADEAVKSEDSPDFLALARSVRARKFGAELPRDRKERARQARFLQYRGFSTDHIRAVLEGDPEADSDPDSGSELETP